MKGVQVFAQTALPGAAAYGHFTGLYTYDVFTYGGSARMVVHQNMPVPQSVDFLLYRNDPNKPMILFAPEKYDANQFAWSVSVVRIRAPP